MPPLVAGKRRWVVGEDDPESSPGIKSADVDVDPIGAGGAYTASTTSAGPSTGGPGERPDRER
jgi:hypothetical protein